MSDQGEAPQPWPIPALSHEARPMGACVPSLSAASSDAIYELWWSDVNKWKTPWSVWPWIFNALERGGASLVSVTFGRLRGIGLQRVIKKYKNRYPTIYWASGTKSCKSPSWDIKTKFFLPPSFSAEQNICVIESYFALFSLVILRNPAPRLADLGTSIVLAGDRLFI